MKKAIPLILIAVLILSVLGMGGQHRVLWSYDLYRVIRVEEVSDVDGDGINDVLTANSTHIALLSGSDGDVVWNRSFGGILDFFVLNKTILVVQSSGSLHGIQLDNATDVFGSYVGSSLDGASELSPGKVYLWSKGGFGRKAVASLISFNEESIEWMYVIRDNTYLLRPSYAWEIGDFDSDKVPDFLVTFNVVYDVLNYVRISIVSGTDGSTVREYNISDREVPPDPRVCASPDLDGDSLSEPLLIARDNYFENWLLKIDQSKLKMYYLGNYNLFPNFYGDTAIDVNGDGIGDILVYWRQSISAISGLNGRTLWTTDVQNISGSFVPGPDLDGDEIPDIAAYGSKIWIISASNGSVMRQRDANSPVLSPIDLDGDGVREILDILPGTIEAYNIIEDSYTWQTDVFLGGAVKVSSGIKLEDLSGVILTNSTHLEINIYGYSEPTLTTEGYMCSNDSMDLNGDGVKMEVVVSSPESVYAIAITEVEEFL